MRCPIHADGQERSASASLNISKGVWFCQTCGIGGSIASLIKEVKNGTREPTPDPPSADEIGEATYDPFESEEKSDVINISSRRVEREVENAEKINEAKVLTYCRYLWSQPRKVKYLLGRGISEEVLREYEIGFDESRGRYTIPIRDSDGALVNIRRYSRKYKPKMTNASGHGSPPRLFPISSLDGEDETVVVCEGEWDALVLLSNGIRAVTGTHGASTWDPRWSEQFDGLNVFVCYDNDREGRVGGKKAAKTIRKFAKSVATVQIPVEKDHGDICDLWTEPDALDRWRQAVAEATPLGTGSEPTERAVSPEIVPVRVVGSMDSRTNGKALQMSATVTGKKGPTYSVPRKVHLECGMDAGPRCKGCIMNTEYEGDHDMTVEPTDVDTISQFIDSNKSQTLEILRGKVGAAKCSRLHHEEIESYSVEELFVTGSIDNSDPSEEADYTHRRIYNVGGFDTETNQSVTVIGTTHPSPKDRHNEFFSWELKEAITSIDKFEVTDGLEDRLSIFCPQEGQTALQKCREIAKDLGDNVTGITGRERLHMAYDLVFHSALGFELDGRQISRGWLEFLVVGDTRTGKSETAIRMRDHYGLGHLVGCEGATFAGLVGGVKQVGDKWTINWGEITLNDRRLVILDEVSGLSQDIISRLSDIRSRGEAQLTKVERHQARARCRLIWISNPRKSGFIEEKKYDGIDIIEDLIGNPEDIARFDFAMSVSQSDVPGSEINKFNKDKVPPTYTTDLCQELILWVWSRGTDHVKWSEGSVKKIYEAAEWLGKRYIDHPPLIQRTNVREKIARISVAIAARTFSHDESMENIVVNVDHVVDAVHFMDEIYSYDNFGYRRVSQRVFRNMKIAEKNRKKIHKWLLTNPRLVEFLLDRRGSFRAQDLEEMANLIRDEVSIIIGKLSDAKMISKQKSQIQIEPELNDILKQIERDRRKK